MKFRIIYTIIAASLIFSACSKDSKCFKSNGKHVTENRTIGNFNTIEIKGKLDVELVNRNDNSISISGGENLVGFITSEISNGTLVIDNQNNCNWMRSYKNGKIMVKISTNNLEHLKINGLGRVFSLDTLHSSNIKIEFITGVSDVDLTISTTNTEIILHDGGGDLLVKGKSKNINIYNNGYAKLDLLNLEAEYVFLANKSQNQTFINASKQIDVEIYDVGNVYYKGNPSTIKLTPYSDGKLIEL